MARYKTWSAWGWAFIGAMRGGVLTALLAAPVINLSGLDIKWRQFGILCAAAGVSTAIHWLKDNPFPKEPDPT